MIISGLDGGQKRHAFCWVREDIFIEKGGTDMDKDTEQHLTPPVFSYLPLINDDSLVNNFMMNFVNETLVFKDCIQIKLLVTYTLQLTH